MTPSVIVSAARTVNTCDSPIVRPHGPYLTEFLRIPSCHLFTNGKFDAVLVCRPLDSLFMVPCWAGAFPRNFTGCSEIHSGTLLVYPLGVLSQIWHMER